jgi:hypothetical protein
MAITVKHKFVSTIPDGTDTTIVRPSNWNDDHQLSGTVPIANGGTGASDAATALSNLGAYPASNPSGYGTGSVTSVAATVPSFLSVSGSPITTNGTLAISYSGTALPVSNGGTGITTLTAGYIPYGNGTGSFSSNSGLNYTAATTTLNTPVLSVNSTTSTTPNLTFNASNSGITSGASIANNYLQTIIQNKSGTTGASTNYVLSNDLGTDSSYYGEFGMNSSVYSSGTPTDFFSLNNGIYFSGHDGDLTIGSGNGYKTYFAWGTSGQSAHVINTSGAIGLNTNITGTTNFGTSGQVLTSQGNAASPIWATPTTGTVTSVAALTLGTTGTDLSSSVANGTTTPVITLNVPTASATNRGALSAADWTTFNNKQPAGAYLTGVIADSPLTGSGTSASHLSIPAATGSVNGYLTSSDWTTFNNKASAITYTTNYIPYGQGTTTPAQSSQFQYNGTYLLVGAASALGGLTNPVAAFTGNPGTTNYVQSYVYNAQNGISSSADIVAYASNSTDSHGWADLGFTSPTYADSVYTCTGPNEAYLFGSALNSSYTGNLVYATDSTGSANAHQWYVGGFTQAKSAYKMQLNSTALTMNGAGIVATAGTASIAPVTLTSGTNLTTATAGAIEYDGNNFYFTVDTSQGRNVNLEVQQFYLSAAGSALSGATQNVFGSNSAASLAATSTYDIECFCYFLKTTTGTVQWIPTFSSSITMGHSYLEYTPVTGFTSTVITGAMVPAEASQVATTTLTHLATASLTTAVYHVHKLRIRVVTNAPCNFRLNNTIGTGSITMQAGSYYTVRKVVSNAGNFVA